MSSVADTVSLVFYTKDKPNLIYITVSSLDEEAEAQRG